MRFAVPSIALLSVALLGGCGDSEGDYENNPRPPAPINVTAAISDDRVSVSPQKFGAGPINLIVSNQTDQPTEVMFESDELGGSESGIAPQSTGPIRPDGTATIKVDVREGSYALRAESHDDSVKVEVGAPRPSAQNELLQP